MEATGKGGKFPGPASNLLLMAGEIELCVWVPDAKRLLSPA